MCGVLTGNEKYGYTVSYTLAIVASFSCFLFVVFYCCDSSLDHVGYSHLTKQADYWSFGILIFRAITNEYPFRAQNRVCC